MPRPDLPGLCAVPEAAPYALDEYARLDIAKTLDCPPGDEFWGLLEDGIGQYLSSVALSKTCTVAGVLRVLLDLGGKPAARTRALNLLAAEDSAIDRDTFSCLSGAAQAVLAGYNGADAVLAARAARRVDELHAAARIVPSTEAFAQFCSYLHLVWGAATGRWLQPDGYAREDLVACRRFAIAVIQSAGLGADSLVEHPGRLDEFLLLPFFSEHDAMD